MGIAKKSIVGIGGQLYILFIGLASTIIIARLLGPEGKGILALVAAVSSFGVGVASFGLGSALAFLSGKDRYSRRELISAALAWSLALGVVVGIGAWAARDLLLGSVLRGMSSVDFAVVLFALPAYYLGAFIGALLAGEGRAVEIAGLQVAAATVNLAGVIVASLLVPRNTSAVVVAMSASALINAAIALITHRSGLTFSPLRLLRVTRTALPYAAKSYVGQASSMFFLRGDVFFLNYFAGASVVGVYSVATSLAEKLWMLSNPISTAVYRRITGSSQSDSARISTLTGRSLLVVNGFAGIALLLISIGFIPLVYGPDFADAIYYLGLLVPGIVIFSMSQPYGQFFSGQLGRPGVTSALLFIMMALSAVLYIVMIPTMGAAGAALASTISYSFALVGYLWLMPRAASVTPREMLVPTRQDIQLYKSIAESALQAVRRRLTRG